ncbi:RrF2 family transcriptional regulator [Candidatus Omnitrophota bacterium]
MRITYRGDYALKAILDLSLRYGGGVVTIHDLARHTDTPIKFLEQVLLDLKRGGFVESRRGKDGGYSLAKSPAQITLGDVIRYIDGPLEPISCIHEKYKGCNEIYKCVFRPIWLEVGRGISGIVDNITFEDLARRLQISKKSFVYQI